MHGQFNAGLPSYRTPKTFKNIQNNTAPYSSMCKLNHFLRLHSHQTNPTAHKAKHNAPITTPPLHHFLIHNRNKQRNNSCQRITIYWLQSTVQIQQKMGSQLTNVQQHQFKHLLNVNFTDTILDQQQQQQRPFNGL